MIVLFGKELHILKVELFFDQSPQNFVQSGQNIFGNMEDAFGHCVAVNENGNTFVASSYQANYYIGYLIVYEFDGFSWNKRVQLGLMALERVILAILYQ